MNLKDMLSDSNVDIDDNFNEAAEVEAAAEAYADILECEAEIASTEHQIAALEDWHEHLSSAVIAVEAYGLSKGMMMLIDRNGDLSEVTGMPAMESLDDLPTAGAMAEEAAGGFKETMKKIWTKIKEFFKKIGAFIARVWQRFLDLFRSNEKIAVAILAKLNKVSDIDSAKLREAKIKYPVNPVSAEQFKTDAKTISAAFNTSPAIDKTFTEEEAKAEAERVLSAAAAAFDKLEVVKSASVENGSLKVEFDKEAFKTDEEFVSDINKDAAQAKTNVNNAIGLFKATTELANLDKSTQKYINSNATTAERLSKSADESKKPLVTVYKAYQQVAKAGIKVSAALAKLATKTATAEMQAARALISAGKVSK